MSGKYLVLMILSIVAGIGFIGCGIYFLSGKFVNKLNEACDFDENKKKNNILRAKGSGYMALGIGAVTLVFAFFVGIMPAIAPVLAVVYMIVLVIGFAGLTIVFKIPCRGTEYV